MKIFKYRETESTWTKKIFEDKALYFAPPSSFNDPFDSMVHPEPVEQLLKDLDKPVPKDFNTKLQYHLNLIAEQHEKDPDHVIKLFSDIDLQLSFEEKKVIFANYCAQFLPDSYYIDTLHNVLFEKSGILSMTKEFDNILMWSHYADNHKGICLEFDQEILSTSFGACYEVNYDWNVPTPTMSTPGDYFLTKSFDWKYENEIRFYEIVYPWENGDAARSKPFPSEALTGIIFGCRILPKDYKTYLALAQKLNPLCKIYRAQKKYGEYRLQIVEVK